MAIVLGCAVALVADNSAVAQGQGKGPPDAKGGQQQKAKKEHRQKNAQGLLGAKMKQNGKHAVDKLSNRTVTADVSNGKVRTMAAGDLPMKRVRSKEKMASLGGETIASGGVQLAQFYETYWYGFCFDDGFYFTCYWYPATVVYYEDYSWDDYSDYYYY